jgi:hypothetical protein
MQTELLSHKMYNDWNYWQENMFNSSQTREQYLTDANMIINNVRTSIAIG